MTVNVTADTYGQLVEKESQPVILDVWAPWCPPCRMIEPILSDLAQAHEGRIVVAKLNADEEPELTARLGVRSLPTVRVLKGGKVVFETIGAAERSKMIAALEVACGVSA